MWGKGIGSPDPDVPKMVVVLGGREEESSRLEDWDSGRRCEDFSKQIRTEFEECRTSKDTTVQVLALIGTRDSCEIVHRIP